MGQLCVGAGFDVRNKFADVGIGISYNWARRSQHCCQDLSRFILAISAPHCGRDNSRVQQNGGILVVVSRYIDSGRNPSLLFRIPPLKYRETGGQDPDAQSHYCGLAWSVSHDVR